MQVELRAAAGGGDGAAGGAGGRGEAAAAARSGAPADELKRAQDDAARERKVRQTAVEAEKDAQKKLAAATAELTQLRALAATAESSAPSSRAS